MQLSQIIIFIIYYLRYEFLITCFHYYRTLRNIEKDYWKYKEKKWKKKLVDAFLMQTIRKKTSKVEKQNYRVKVYRENDLTKNL